MVNTVTSSNWRYFGFVLGVKYLLISYSTAVMHQILVPVRSGVKLKPAASSLTNNSMGFATFVEGK